MEQDYNLKKWSKGCPNTGINCRRSSCGIEYVFIPAALGDDQEGSPVAPKNGSYNNAIVYYEATGNVYLYSSDGVPTRVEKNLDSIIEELQRELNDVEEALSEETTAREAADAAIEEEIEHLRNNPDVVDIVATYADLLTYDPSELGDKDVIRVLTDETHDDESTYYRWDKPNQEWVFIGAVEGYYTKDQTDTLLSGKQNVLTAGDNISITNDTISAVDTTYTAGNGLDLTGTEFSVDGTVVALQSDLPTNTSDLTNDGADGTSTYVEADELATVATTGNYTDLLNTPTIPTVNDATLTIQKNSTDVGTFTANASSNSTINITVPTTAADVSALPDSTKYAASISLTIDSSTYVVTAQLKDQDNNNIGSSQTIDLPLESVVVSGSYDSQTKEVVLTLQSGSTIRFSVADLVSGLQTEITSQNPLDADLVDDSTSTNKFVTSTDITTWNGKQNALTAGSNISISGDTISATDTTYSAGTGLNLTGTQFSIDNTVALKSEIPTNNAQLTNGAGYLTNTDYAGSNTAGVIKTHPNKAIGTSGSGLLYAFTKTAEDFASAEDSIFVGKGTLNNVLVGKQDTLTAGSNIQIANNTISATDTTYSDFTGTDGTTAGAAGLVPAPATTDAGKFLKADGTWDTAGSAINVVQTTGTSTTDVMSQNAVTSMVYADPDNKLKIQIGKNSSTSNNNDIAIGRYAQTSGGVAIAIGGQQSDRKANASALGAIAIGPQKVVASGNHSVAIGNGASATQQGQFDISSTGWPTDGYNNSAYRLLTGLYDPQSDHDAATKGYVDNSLLGKQDKLTAGANITIDANNVISATGGGSGGVSDVQIDGTSIVNAGIANIGYASTATGGVIRVNSAYGVNVAGTGTLIGVTKSYSSYGSSSDLTIIDKGTLENVITGKGLVDQTDLATKQDVLTAGSNIQINGSTISATDTTYTAGNGLSLVGTEFSADTTVLATQTDLATKQDVLTAGTGISITNNVISATGGAPLTLTVTPDQQDQYSFTWSGATIQQIETAFNAGTTILLSMEGNILMVTNATFSDNSQSQRTAQLSICFAGVGSAWDLNPDGSGELHPFEYATTDQIANKPSLVLSTTDIGEGVTLAANTLYGVYE